MSGMIRRGTMAAMQSNLAAIPTTAAAGTSITSGAANTKGATWTTLIASTNFDVWGITLIITNNTSSATQRNWLFDIGVGASSSEQPIVLNLGSSGPTNLTGAGPNAYFLPLFVPKGARISARAQCNAATITANVLIFVHGGPSDPPWQVYSRCDCYTANTGTSACGTAVAVPSTAGTESAWTNVGSTTPRAYYAIKLIVGTDALTTVNNAVYHVEWGYSSTTLGEYVVIGNNVECVAGIYPVHPDPIFIPSGTQLQIRTESSLATGETAFQYGFLGFY